MSDKVWIVALGDGTFVEMDELPIVALVTRDYLDKIDAEGGDFPIDCTDDANGEWEAHIHIYDLVMNSDFRDETQAGLTAMDFGGPASMVISDPNASWNLPK